MKHPFDRTGVLLFLLVGVLAFPVFSQTRSIGAIAGWQLPGLADVQVNATPEQGGVISASMRLARLGSQPALRVIAFRAPGRQAFTIAVLLPPRFSFSALEPALGNTPLADLRLDGAVLFLVPPGSGAADAAVPPALAQALGKPSVALVEGVHLVARPTISGPLATLLTQAGVPNFSPQLTGRFDPAWLSAPAGTPALTASFLQMLDLSVALPEPKASWLPAFLKLDDARLTIKGEQAGVVAAISARVTVSLGAPQLLVFPDTQLSRDLSSGTITLSGGPMKPTKDMLSLPAGIASLDRLSFVGTAQGGTGSFTLKGDAQIEGRSAPFTVSLSGAAGRADYAFSLGTARSLADLLGWSVPGLEDIQVSNITLGSGAGASAAGTGVSGYTGGTLRLFGVDAGIYVFKPPNSNFPLAAITLPSLHLPDFLPGTLGTALDGLQMLKPGFILAHPSFTAQSLSLPGPVASHLGSAAGAGSIAGPVSVKPGLNLKGLAKPSGTTGSLLSAAGLGTALSGGLPLAGGLDPRLLKGGALGADVLKAILASVDFDIPLGALSFSDLGPLLSGSDASLILKGQADGGILAGIRSDVTVSAGTHRYAFDALLTLDRQATGTQTRIAGTYPAKRRGTGTAAIDTAFGISWLKLEDAKLAVTLGTNKSIAVSGTTSLGTIKDLTATVYVDAQGGKVSDWGVSLTGADIGLADIPQFAAIKELPDIRFRDLVVSETEVAGTIRTSNQAFNNLRAVVFRNQGKLSLAAYRESFSLADIVPLHGVGRALLGDIRFDKGLLLVSQGGVKGPVSSLPESAAKLFASVYGSPAYRLNFGDGFNVALSGSPAGMGQAASKLGLASGQLVLDGGIEGVFGGTPSFKLSAAIGPIRFPPTLNFLDLPRNLQTAFFVRLSEADAALGVSVSGDFPMKTRNGAILFTSALDFEADTSGGLAVAFSATSDTPWPNPLGIPGITLNPGTALSAKLAATSEVDLSLVGKSKIGQREIDLAGSVGVLAEGVVDKAALSGYLDEIGIADLLVVASGTGGAGAGSAANSGFPDVRLKKVNFAFASPGAVLQGMDLVGGGARVSGDLWFLLKDKPLGTFLAKVDGTGIQMSGSVSDIEIGPVALRGNSLDARATLVPPAPPYFKLTGGATVFGKQQDMALQLSADGMELSTDVDLGQLLKFDFRAKGDLPDKGFAPAELAKLDLSLDARLRSDIPAWLRGPGRKPVERIFAEVEKDLARFSSDLTQAEKNVASLNGQIETTRATVNREKRSVINSLQDAQDHVDTLAASIRSLDRQISDADARIHRCDYEKSICSWYDVIKKKCTDHKNVPDFSRNASCVADNLKYGGILADRKADKLLVVTAKATADSTLAAFKRGESIDTVDLDPRVAPLIVARDSAQAALTLAQQAAQGALKAGRAFQTALDDFARSDAFVLNDSRIQGSMAKAIKGQPVLLGLDFSSLGQRHFNSLAFSLTNPEFDAEQLATLGLFIASKLLNSAYGDEPTMKPILAMVNDAYVVRKNAEDKQTAQVMKDNDLE